MSSTEPETSVDQHETRDYDGSCELSTKQTLEVAAIAEPMKYTRRAVDPFAAAHR